MAIALLLKLHAQAAEEKYTEAGLAAMASSHSRRDSVDSLLAALQLNPDNQEALAGLERILTNVAGFAPAKAGGTQRDAEGRWQFSFTLAEERADVD